MNNLKSVFENKKAVVPFFVCGNPNLEKTGDFVREAEKNGADMVVLGIPFSDPTVEGMIVQAANIRALKAGVTTDKIFAFVKKMREDVQIPLVFMTYANVVFSYGTEKFMAACKELKIEGIILHDIPFEEKDEFAPICKEYGICLISQIAPASEERMAMIAKEAEGFLYIISGGKTKEEMGKLIKAVRENTTTPCMVVMENLGLEHVHMVAEMVDGMMPDQGLVQLIAEHGDDAAVAVGQYVKEMKQAVTQ